MQYSILSLSEAGKWVLYIPMVGHVFSACWEDGDMVVWVLFILLIVGATFVFKFMKTVMWLLLYFLFL